MSPVRPMRGRVGRPIYVASLVAAATACTAAPPPPPEGRDAPRATSAPRAAPSEDALGSSSGDARCNEPANVAKVEIARGATERTDIGIAVTYLGTEHDSFEDGRTDTIVPLTFQGILDDGRLTPSALTWRPSAFAAPTWVHLGSMPLCVRVQSANEDRTTLELFRSTRL
jgi:hypothetical protein